MDIKDTYMQKTDLKQVKTYEQLKASLAAELVNASESFVRIGYLLRRAKDTGILHESGYRDIHEFALAEFNLEKSAVSRFMDINEKYSEGGYSDRLKEKYRGYGVAKLAEMLTIPEAIANAITPEHTREQIREIKRELKEEQETTEIERMQEETVPEPVVLDTLCKRFLYYYFRTKEGAEAYVRIFRLAEEGTDERKIQETLAPSGVNTLFARVPQVGKLMLAIKGFDKPVDVINMRNNEHETLPWEELLNNLYLLMPQGYKPEECWEMIYAEDFPGQVKKELPKQVKTKETESGENPVSSSLERHQEPDQKEPENSEKSFQETAEKEDEGRKEEKKPENTEPKTPENAINPHTDGQSPDGVKTDEDNADTVTDKAEEYLEYLRECIRMHRWQQALFTIRDLNDEVLKLRDREKIIDIPGQMSMEELEGGTDNETEDEE